MKLPLVDFISRNDDSDLSNYSLIACQHLLQGNMYLLLKLVEKGLKYKNIHFIPKSYSFNESIFGRLKKEGARVFSYKYDSHKSFDDLFGEEITTFLSETEIVTESLIILDDGAELISRIRKFFPNKNLYAVEQTSSGFNKLKELDLDFPVVNVARSEAKLKFESPFIAERIVEELKKRVNFSDKSKEKILVLGKGYIGECIANQLEPYFLVNFFDSLGSRSDINQLEKEVHTYDIILGCTGSESLSKEILSLTKRGVLLASASSSDREFDSVNLRKLAPKNNNPHLDLEIDGKMLLNSGFPINFNGSQIDVPLNKIQLTYGLLLAAIFQSIKETTPGLKTLDKEIQEKLVSMLQSQ